MTASQASTRTACEILDALPDPLQLTLPGGVTMERINLMELVQPALTPLVPIFDLVDAIVAVFNCVKAIPDTIGPPPDPTKLAACMPELAAKVAKLLRLVPQLSLPLMVVGLIDLVIDALRQARSQLQHLQQQMVQSLGVIQRARELDDAGLMDIGLCAQANVTQEAANVTKSLAAMGKLMGLVNLFMGMVGGPEVPDVKSLAGQPLDQVIAPLDAIVEALQTARDAVPVP